MGTNERPTLTTTINYQQLTINNYLFTGQELDDELDLYNYNARLYNSETGSFISADSVGGGNRCAYAANNPLIFTDPTGHMVDAGGGGRSYLPLITKGWNGDGGIISEFLVDALTFNILPPGSGEFIARELQKQAADDLDPLPSIRCIIPLDKFV